MTGLVRFGANLQAPLPHPAFSALLFQARENDVRRNAQMQNVAAGNY